MTNDRPLPEPEDDKFWPQLIAWQTREANDAERAGFPDHAATWREHRAKAVSTWASQEVRAASPLPHLPDGASRRGRKGH